MQQTPLSQLPEFSDSRREPYGPDVFPEGFRAMTAAEGDELDALRSVLIFDRESRSIALWSVESYSRQWGWRVVQRDGGEVVDSLRLDEDDPDCWSDVDVASGRARRGPEAEHARYVAVVPVSTTDLTPLLRASLYPLIAQDVLQQTAETRAGWFHTSDGRYFASEVDRRQYQRMLNEKANRQHRRAARSATAVD
jgi:hypothetical protein